MRVREPTTSTASAPSGGICQLDRMTTPNTNPNMKCFRISGQGDFSPTYGWDNGIRIHVLEECDYYEVREIELADEGMLSVGGKLPPEPCWGEFYQVNSHGGSRELHGYIVAPSRGAAINWAQEIENGYEVVEYERPD